MAHWRAAPCALLLAACQAGPVSPNVESRREFITQLNPEEITTGLFISVPGQLVSVEQATEVERAWVTAHLTAGTDRVPISDGAILVVSAADGPMPQTNPDAETLSIQVRSAVVDAAGVVRFGGIATLTTGRVTSPPFEIDGTARPAAVPAPSAPPPAPHVELAWDITSAVLPAPLTFTTVSSVRPR